MRSYSGRLDVRDDAFKLVAEDLRLVPGERVVFAFRGEDTGGPFTCEGVATRAASGFYVAAGVRLIGTRRQIADIRFQRLEADSESCVVEGWWAQDGYLGSPWSFWGELDGAAADA